MQRTDFKNIPQGFRIFKNVPIDARNVIESFDELETKIPLAVRYYGLFFFVRNENNFYMFESSLTEYKPLFDASLLQFKVTNQTIEEINPEDINLLIFLEQYEIAAYKNKILDGTLTVKNEAELATFRDKGFKLVKDIIKCKIKDSNEDCYLDKNLNKLVKNGTKSDLNSLANDDNMIVENQLFYKFDNKLFNLGAEYQYAAGTLITTEIELPIKNTNIGYNIKMIVVDNESDSIYGFVPQYKIIKGNNPKLVIKVDTINPDLRYEVSIS